MFFFPRENQTRTREKVWKTLKKCPWNDKFAREVLQKIMPVKKKLMHVKKNGKKPRENTNFCPKSIKFVPVKEKDVGVKKLENGPKSGREIGFLPVKKLKKWPKMAFTGTFFYVGKKKNWFLQQFPNIAKCVFASQGWYTYFLHEAMLFPGPEIFKIEPPAFGSLEVSCEIWHLGNFLYRKLTITKLLHEPNLNFHT